MLYWGPVGVNILEAKSVVRPHYWYRIEEIPAIGQWSVKQYLKGDHHMTMLKCTRAESLEAAKGQARGWDNAEAYHPAPEGA